MYYNKQCHTFGSQRSCIRELFEYGRGRAAIVGAENVLDFSLGNPSVPAPKELNQAIIDILSGQPSLAVHGYTSAPGTNELRQALANDLNERFGIGASPANFYVTCGASAAVTSSFGALTVSPDDEFIAIAPYFPEYNAYVAGAGGKLRIVPADEENFQIRFNELEKAINEHTKGVIINSPNNPSGVVYTEETIKRLAWLLTLSSKEYGHPIFIISDDPYRELVYGVEVPFVPNYYDNTIVCYSFSKSLSMPGERIGYVFVSPKAEDSAGLFNAVAGAARKFGYVCAPSLLQKAVTACVGLKPDLKTYVENRDLLYNSLTAMGYKCAHPDGAFYLFVRSPKGSGQEFSDAAKKRDVLIVPCADFGCPDFLRISYCVDKRTIEKALPVFKELIEE